MSDLFGDDIITITDEDGVEYVLEVLATMEVDGSQYYALVPASNEEDEDLECILDSFLSIQYTLCRKMYFYGQQQ